MTRSLGGAGKCHSDRGVALVMVIWIFMVLTVLVGEFSRAMRDDAVATHNVAEENQARGVAIAGMNHAIYRALRAREQPEQAASGRGAARASTVLGTENGAGADETEAWAADGTWHDGSYGGGDYSVRVVDEGGKVGLNRADEALLRQVLGALGLDQDAQEAATDGILDWRDSDSLRRLHGAEAEYYLGLPEPYLPKDGWFDSVDELLLVRGISRDVFYGVPAAGLRSEDSPAIPLRDVFSVFNRTANINVRTAPPAVLRVLLGGEERDVEEIVAARDADAGSALTLLRAKLGDQLLARRLVDTEPIVLAIDARAKMQDGRVEARVGAVLDLGEDGDGFHIVRWFDRLPAL